MVTTERATGAVIGAGILGCLGMMLWPREAPQAPQEASHASASGASASIVAGEPEAGAADLADPWDVSMASTPVEIPSASLMALAKDADESDGAAKGATLREGRRGFMSRGEAEVQFATKLTMMRRRETSRLVADANGDGDLSLEDRDAYEGWWNDGSPQADMNKDGWVDTYDLAAFYDAFNLREREQVRVAGTAHFSGERGPQCSSRILTLRRSRTKSTPMMTVRVATAMGYQSPANLSPVRTTRSAARKGTIPPKTPLPMW